MVIPAAKGLSEHSISQKFQLNIYLNRKGESLRVSSAESTSKQHKNIFKFFKAHVGKCGNYISRKSREVCFL